MTFSGDVPQYFSINKVKAGSEEAFEAFVRDEIIPASQQARPDLADSWAALRPSGPDEDGTTPYAFAFYGDHPLSEWDLRELLIKAHGNETGEAKFVHFLSLLQGNLSWTFTASL